MFGRLARSLGYGVLVRTPRNNTLLCVLTRNEKTHERALAQLLQSSLSVKVLSHNGTIGGVLFVGAPLTVLTVIFRPGENA